MTRTLFDVAVERRVVSGHHAEAFARFHRAHDAFAAIEGHPNQNVLMARSPDARLYEKLIGRLGQHKTAFLMALTLAPSPAMHPNLIQQRLDEFKAGFQAALEALGHELAARPHLVVPA